MIRIVSICVVAWMAAAGGIAQADGVSDGQRCAASAGDPNVAINYCVRAIFSGELSQHQLAATYYNRAWNTSARATMSRPSRISIPPSCCGPASSAP